MSNFEKSIIPPETIAAKLAAAANLSEPAFAALITKEPRLVELLWFLQWTSMQPGGLEKFADDVVEQFAPRFGPAFLHQDSQTLSPKQRLEVWELMPQSSQNRVIPPAAWQCETNSRSQYWDGHYLYQRVPKEDRVLLSLLSHATPAQFRDEFIHEAKSRLAPHLRSMCDGPGTWLTDAPWYCLGLVAVLFEAMELHASRVQTELAPTQIVSTVFETLEFAWSQKVLVQMEGSSRFGKTEAVKAWSRMHPGRCRLISTPGSNYDRDMYKAVAESLGSHFTYNTGGTQLKEKVEFIVRHSGLMFIFDEAHFLLPQRMTATTLPARLNWLRTQIIDRKLPVAIVTTPQAFSHAVNKFTKTTGYNFEQLLGRIAHAAALPDSLGQEDLMAIAKFHGPELAEPLLKIIVGKSLQQQIYIAAVENIIRRARWNAARAGHPAVTAQDVDLAASGRIHGQPGPAPLARPDIAPEPHPIAQKRRAVPLVPSVPSVPSFPDRAARFTTTTLEKV
jgi:hypothetical protein